MVIRNFISAGRVPRTIAILLDSDCHLPGGLIPRAIFPPFLLLLLFICGLKQEMEEVRGGGGV